MFVITIHLLLLIHFTVTEQLESVSGIIRPEAGYILDMSSAGHRANTERHSHIHIFKKSKQTNTKTPFKYSLCVDDYHSNENKFFLFFLKVYNTENSCESQKVTAFDRAGSCMTHILTPRYHQTRALTNRRFKVVKPCCKSKGAE